MQIILIKQEKLYKYPFPNELVANYWIKDNDEFGNERDLINAENQDNAWVLLANKKCKIVDNNEEIDIAPMTLNKFYLLKITNDDNTTTNALIYVCNENDPSYTSYQFTTNGEYKIGSASTANIIINVPNIAAEHAAITKENNKFIIKAIDNNIGIYVNDYREAYKILENGDIIFILGYKMIVLNDCLIINGFNHNVVINSPNIVQKDLPHYNGELIKTTDDDSAELYNETDYFSRSPRFVTTIADEDISIDNPPGTHETDETPLIYTIGPMITMALSSVMNASVSIINFSKGNGTLLTILPTMVLSIVMLVSTVLWPTLMRKYTKKKTKEKDKENKEKYTVYLEDKKNKIEQIRINQFQILTENYPEPKNLENIILNKRRNLWERKNQDEDFLNVRLGIGNIPLKLNVKYTSEDFSLTTDEMKEALKSIGENSKEIVNAPVTANLVARNKLVIIGEKYYQESMLKSIILQLVTYHSYNDLKLVLMIDENKTGLWEEIKILPHLWSNARDIRFYANNFDDMSKVSFYLEQEYMARKYNEDDGNRVEQNLDYQHTSPYYLIIVDNIKKNKNVEIINKVLKEQNNLGFGLIILNNGISNLPNECRDFLTAAGEKSAIITNDLNKENQQIFTMDNTDNIDLPLLCEKLSNIPIKTEMALSQKSTVSFLEMYKVGKVEQLNILDRWSRNNPVNSLSVPIGMHTDGEIFNLDLHEKFHGPHGLIAGMTGSGKSEFIITFILSMCLNFSPEEVSFVLIDYKGGGLTGAFENKMTGQKLPHLAGTITNLDKAEINRSLSSIQSELKRRQALFNNAKLELNESTIDIYKYQKLYRDGKIKEPISHLFIISDEFAELKSQQPNFMSELISTARIGRSLGVHLILATQKPSGIVDDQIWSNSKFKVCLKVQEKADSMDVIKCPDAAALKQVGRFYLQVGYNDYFAMGQSAYSGAKYIPRDKITKTVDRSISFINNIGDTINSIETTKKVEVASMGEELPNVLNYICQAAKAKNMEAKKLWLDKIPAEIFVNDLMNKYHFKPEKWQIKPIVGEYDDPSNQRQDLLTIDFNDTGNTIIYGIDGKEIMLSSMIYSLIIAHTSEELNIYIIDFGTETFGMFKSAPQVGDVIYISETEKLVNLFNSLNNELEKRKKLLIDYNGDYNLYIKSGHTDLPRIVVAINNYEVFSENCEDYIDIVSGFSREGERYGIVFIITATGVNAVRGKTSQNFSNQLCLQFNDPSDYTSILGSTHGMVPSDITGRGLVKLQGEIYEFQTAYPCKWDEVNTFIKNVIFKLNSVIKTRASEIAVLPEHVRINNIAGAINSLKSVPIGIEKNTLAISSFDFDKNKISLVSSQDSSLLDNFLASLAIVFQKMPNVDTYVFDANEGISDHTLITNYYNNNYSDMLTKMEVVYATPSEKTSIFIISGLDTIKNGLSDEEQKKLMNVLLSTSTKPNIRIVLSGAISKIKGFEYEEFYRKNVEPINGIWIGSGITDQFTIKSSTYNKETRSPLPNEFGYNVNRGTATLIKVLDFYIKD